MIGVETCEYCRRDYAVIPNTNNSVSTLKGVSACQNCLVLALVQLHLDEVIDHLEKALLKKEEAV